MIGRAFKIAVVAIAGLVLAGVPRLHTLAEPDEGRYADVAGEMARGGDWITPHLDGVRFLDKPPLLIWFGATAVRLIGPSIDAPRLPARAAAVAAAIVLAWAAVRLSRRREAGWMAAALYLSSFGIALMERLVSIDIVFAACTSAAIAVAGLAIARSAEGARLRVGEAAGFGLALGAATLAKGLAAWVLVGSPLAVAWMLDRRRKDVWRACRPAIALPLAIGTALPWFVLVERRNPGFLSYFVLHEHVQRFTTADPNRWLPPGTLAVALGVAILPWSALGVRALWRSFRAPRDQVPPGHRFLALAALTPVVFFSLSRSELLTYVLPSVGPLALLVAAGTPRDIDDGTLTRRSIVRASALVLLAAAVVVVSWALDGVWLEAKAGTALRWLSVAVGLWAVGAVAACVTRRPGTAVAALLAGGLCGSVLLPFAIDAAVAAREHDGLPVAAELQRWDARGALVVAYRSYVRAVPFVLGHPVPVIGWDDEIGYDLTQPDTVTATWNDAWLRNLWQSDRWVVVFTYPNHAAALREAGLADLHERPLAGHRVLLSNRPWPQ